MTLRSSIIALVLVCFAACDKGAKSPATGAVAGNGRTESVERGGDAVPPPVVGQVGSRIDHPRHDDPSPRALDPVVPEQGAAKVGSASFGNELANLYTAWSAAEQGLLDDAKARMKAAIDGQSGAFTKSVKALYDGRQDRFVWSKGGQLTEDADKLIELLTAVETQGLDPAPYALDDLKAQVKAFSDASLAASTATVTGTADGQGDPAAVGLWRFLVTNRQIAPAALADVAAGAGYSDNDLERLSDARKHLNALLASQKAVNASLADLDVGLSRRMYRWVYDMRFARRAHPFIADKSDAEGVARTEKDIVKLVAAQDLDTPGVTAKLADLVTPKFPDYQPTVVALARYRELAATTTHIELPKDAEKLAIDMKGKAKAKDTIMLLAQRLKQEGYFDGEPSGEFGPELEAAVKAYQETHQLKVSGKLEKVMRVSLNRTFEERAKTLALSLQRYRESDLHQGAFRIGDVPVRARINIPGFDARFYQGVTLARTHRIVVGNNDTETDAALERHGKLNQTRLISAEMATIILNPVWRVPRRIKEQELDSLLMDEPDYYEKHNFKVEVQPDGSELVVQQSGAGNALGLVKFLFPNQFSIYMHDTQSKKLFDRPVRAYSHGCMRTQDPLDLAQWILVDLTGQLDKDKFDEVLKSGKETAFQLKKSIPISVDYVTTGVDEQGRIVFYADVYGFDRDYFDGKTPYAADNKLPLTVIF